MVVVVGILNEEMGKNHVWKDTNLLHETPVDNDDPVVDRIGGSHDRQNEDE